MERLHGSDASFDTVERSLIKGGFDFGKEQ